MTPERLDQLRAKTAHIRQYRGYVEETALGVGELLDLLDALIELRTAVGYVENDCSPPGDNSSFGEIPYGMRDPLERLGVLRA